tara:strand:- start:37 stop:216 length:180 start_codon:yes stop_codon:yes gene_type:complete
MDPSPKFLKRKGRLNMALMIKIKKERMYNLDFLQDIILITFFSLLASFITPLIISLNSI